MNSMKSNTNTKGIYIKSKLKLSNEKREEGWSLKYFSSTRPISKIKRLLFRNQTQKFNSSGYGLKRFSRQVEEMTNERITEDYVREHFKNDDYFKSKKALIEEQISSNPRVKKLLSSASKNGIGKGYPEFIISFKDEPEFIIVIECKGDIKKHQSKDRDKYSEYSVDGALLYSSYLSKEFDVLSIAVSGEIKKEIKVSHFLQLKNKHEAPEILGSKLLSIQNYLKEYKYDERKFKQSYEDLLKYSKELNDFLQSKKVKESDRSLLISGILIALDDESFKVAYEKQKNPKSLAENLVNTIKQQLSYDITNEKVEILTHQYNFIKIHPTLSKNSDKDENVLRILIKNIDENINSFMKTNKKTSSKPAMKKMQQSFCVLIKT